jgi:hypothetical protein
LRSFELMPSIITTDRQMRNLTFADDAEKVTRS